MNIRFIANIKGIYFGYAFDQSAVITIGREIGNTIAPINVDGFSRHHARIFYKDGGWYVEDLGSTNGTYRNRVKIEAPEKIEKGDSIRCGLMEIASFDFTEEPVAAAPAAIEPPPSPIPLVKPTVVKLVEPPHPTAPSLITPRKTEIEPVKPVEPIKPVEVVKPIAPAAPAAPAPKAAPLEPVTPLEPVEELKPIEPLEPITPFEPVEELAPVEELKPVSPTKTAAVPRPGGTALRRPTIPGLKPGLKLPQKPGALPTGLKLPTKGTLPAGLKLPPKPGIKPGLKLPTKPA